MRLIYLNDLKELLERPLHTVGLHRQHAVIIFLALLVLLAGAFLIHRHRPKA